MSVDASMPDIAEGTSGGRLLTSVDGSLAPDGRLLPALAESASYLSRTVTSEDAGSGAMLLSSLAEGRLTESEGTLADSAGKLDELLSSMVVLFRMFTPEGVLASLTVSEWAKASPVLPSSADAT